MRGDLEQSPVCIQRLFRLVCGARMGGERS
jgi:hypothetical protein